MGRDVGVGGKPGGVNKNMVLGRGGSYELSSFDWIVISLVLMYILGEILAFQAGKLTNNRRLRALTGRKSFGRRGSERQESVYGGRPSILAKRLDHLRNTNIDAANEDSRFYTVEENSQSGGPLRIAEIAVGIAKEPAEAKSDNPNGTLEDPEGVPEGISEESEKISDLPRKTPRKENQRETKTHPSQRPSSAV